MDKLKIRKVRNKKEHSQVLEIRKKVFISEQRVPLEIEVDGFEDSSEHIIVFYGKKVIGTARIRALGNKLKLERIAILKSFRGKGFGRELMRWLIEHALSRDPEEVYMNAQYYLKDFYSSFGFTARGKIFYEGGIKHIQMYMKPGKSCGHHKGHGMLEKIGITSGVIGTAGALLAFGGFCTPCFLAALSVFGMFAGVLSAIILFFAENKIFFLLLSVILLTLSFAMKPVLKRCRTCSVDSVKKK